MKRLFFTIMSLFLMAGPVWAQDTAPRPGSIQAAPLSLSLAEARIIIEGAIAYTSETGGRMTVVVLDANGNFISGDRMEGASFHLEAFARGKAYMSVISRRSTQEASELYNSRPDRFFGFSTVFPGEVYLAGGGLPIAVDGQLVAGMGIAGLPPGVDEAAAQAGIEAWQRYRASQR